MTAPENAISEGMKVGVVLERRALADPWRDHVWRAVEVVPGAPADISWREIGRDEDSVRYLAATLPVEIHRKETESYRINLTGREPRVFVVLRPEPDGPPGREMRPFLVTVCPFEAGSYGQGGDETVDAVPMPGEIRAWVEDFVARHHVVEPFVKRQRDRADPDKIGFGRRRPGEGRRG
ncbi:MAG: DUF3305 domain-containing protein [Rhodospirillales bacterium]|nr:DUF3305 domain-containing protein [Rhodospirillales bacterium]